MSTLSNIFGLGAINKDWKVLSSISDLDQAEMESHDKPVVLFKHSVTCGISARAKHRLESDYDLDPEKTPLYYLDLLANRDVSNEVANRFGIIHQSPQMIILENGQAVFVTSHHAVSLSELKQNLS